MKHLEDYAYRVQYSVFEMAGTDEDKDTLIRYLLDVMDKKEDSLLVYELDVDSWNKREHFGCCEVPSGLQKSAVIL